jgi:hypothetical protein
MNAAISSDENQVIFVNPKNGEHLKFEECSDDPNSKDPRPCDIFVDKFRTEKVKEIIIIDSIKVDNTKCCRTIFLDGIKKTRCREFSNSITSCPPGWYYY